MERRDAKQKKTKVQWIKGHATKEDVEQGSTTRRDAWGNMRAHELARSSQHHAGKGRKRRKRKKDGNDDKNHG